MKKITFTLVTFLTFSIAHGANTVEKKTDAPTRKSEDSAETKPNAFSGEAKKINELAVQLFEASKNVNKPANESNPNRQKLKGGLDWERVAHDCLGDANWKKYQKGRGEFVDLLQKVILKTAYSRMDKFWDSASYSIEKIDVNGTTGKIGAKFKAKTETLGLDYYVFKKGDRWFIYDIAYDNERYSENIREQLDGFLAGSNFQELIKNLKKRLAELEENAPASKTKKS